MATVGTLRRRRRLGRWPLIIGGVLVVLVVGGLIVSSLGGPAQPVSTLPPGWQTANVETGTIAASISATGNVDPEARAELRFAGTGTVTEVMVTPGEQVKTGQPLARIDPAEAELSVVRAEADLTQARASYTKLANGATPEELTEAQARLTEAQARLQQAQAKVSGADLTAARARLEQAQARLNRLSGGPKDTDRREAEAQLQRSQVSLQSQRDSLSAAKTNAELALQTSVTDLTRAQNGYATAKQNWDFVRETGQDPTNPETRLADGSEVPNKLKDTQRQQYYDAFVAAEQQLRAAEVAVERARISAESARQAEASGVREAEQQLASAQASYDRTIAGADADTLAEARASVASAQAELGRLTGDDRAAELVAAEAGVEIAQAALAKLTKGADPSDLARAEADVLRAEASLKQAQRTLDQTTLTAPFDATIARVDLRVGEQAGQTGIVAVVDLSSFHIDVPVDELDVAQVKAGQQVSILLDALLDQELSGTVTTIEPLATRSDRGSNTYNVTVTLDGASAAVLPGMSATVQIVTQSKESVLLIPRRAIQSENGASFVYTQAAPGAQLPPGQPGERRPVTLGLSNSQSVEVTSGLSAGEHVLVPDVVQTINVNVGGG